jgi:hypothetical protein
VSDSVRHCLLLDKELNFLVRDKAQQQGISISAVMRDALQWYFSLTVNTFDAGWKAGYAEAQNAVMIRVAEALSALQREREQLQVASQSILPPKTYG